VVCLETDSSSLFVHSSKLRIYCIFSVYQYITSEAGKTSLNGPESIYSVEALKGNWLLLVQKLFVKSLVSCSSQPLKEMSTSNLPGV
jgi:hypothetical protein